MLFREHITFRRTFTALLIWLCFWDSRGKREWANWQNLELLGSQGFGLPLGFSTTPMNRYSPQRPFIGILETDAWSHSLSGSLRPVAEIPIPHSRWETFLSFFQHKKIRRDLLCGARFTADDYLEKIRALKSTLPNQRDALLYYGGLRKNPDSEGLNFNGWSVDQLHRLKDLGGQPFIGLETVDPVAIQALVEKLWEAGLGKEAPLYIRVISEPSGMAYGTDNGTSSGKHHTAASYQAYRRRFAQAARQLQALRLRYGMNLKIVFAGTSREDFAHYVPPTELFDDIGYDLYVTPENKDSVLQILRYISVHQAAKPLVIPELGIATAGPLGSPAKKRVPRASPAWGREVLADILVQLGKHPAHVRQITIFSVNVAERIDARRWNWSWTPMMYEILKEWENSPRRWQKQGFHAYDPLSYPTGEDVLFLQRPELRIYYRRIQSEPGYPHPQFLQNTYHWQGNRWIRSSAIVDYPSES